MKGYLCSENACGNPQEHGHFFGPFRILTNWSISRARKKANMSARWRSSSIAEILRALIGQKPMDHCTRKYPVSDMVELYVWAKSKNSVA